MFEEKLPSFLKHYDELFKNHSHPFLFGDKPVIADFLIAGVYINLINNPHVGYAKE